MTETQCTGGFDEVYEVVATRIVAIGDSLIRIEVSKCVKGNQLGHYVCAYYEECEPMLTIGKEKRVASVWVKADFPRVQEADPEAALKRALGWIEGAFRQTKNQ